MHLRALLKLRNLSLLLFILVSAAANANPEGGQVVTGGVTITQTNPSTVTVNQTQQQAIINWNRFNINQGETTHFNQPSSSAIALNRVVGRDPSQILGTLSANGRIMLINPNGVLFGKGSVVDVAGLIVSTGQIKDSDFLKGHYHFEQSPEHLYSRITNDGNIKVADTGLVAFLAPGISQFGVISAKMGRIILAGGEVFTLDFHGDQLISFALERPSTKVVLPIITNRNLHAKNILITARATKKVFDQVVNMNGVAEAHNIVNRNGQIILSEK